MLGPHICVGFPTLFAGARYEWRTPQCSQFEPWKTLEGGSDVRKWLGEHCEHSVQSIRRGRTHPQNRLVPDWWEKSTDVLSFFIQLSVILWSFKVYDRYWEFMWDPWPAEDFQPLRGTGPVDRLTEHPGIHAKQILWNPWKTGGCPFFTAWFIITYRIRMYGIYIYANITGVYWW